MGVAPGWAMLVVGLLLTALARPVAAQTAPPVAGDFVAAVDLEIVGTLAVYNQGRVKSFESFSKEMMQFVSGSRRIDDQSPAFTYLDLMIRPERYVGRDIIFIQMKLMRGQIAEALRRAGAGGSVADFEVRMSRFLETGLIAEDLLRTEPVLNLMDHWRTDLMRTASKVEAIQSALAVLQPQLLKQNLRVVPPPGGGFDDPWFTLDDVSADFARANRVMAIPPDMHQQFAVAWNSFLTSWQKSDAAGVNAASAELARLLPKVNAGVYPAQSRLAWESWYFRAKSMTWVWIIYLFTIVPLLMSVVYRWPAARWIGLLMFAGAFGLHTFAVLLRWYVAERWPNSNMFEAITTAAWFGGCFAVVIEFLVRGTPMRNLFALGSAVASMVALMSVKFFPLQLSPSISNMMPVLHDLWLYIHTNIIIFSYCLIFLAAVTAGLYLIRRGWMWLSDKPGSGEFARVGGAGSLLMTRPDGTSYLASSKTTFGQVLDGSTMILMELSFILLWAGLVMGAIWADHSWGRPWGWDPKEVFALNTFLVFAVLVHVRMKVKDKGLWTAILAMIGCIVMLFNWVIINFTIAGLHSYA
jgi:cytochrome c-type biogenesis protein CcsB